MTIPKIARQRSDEATSNYKAKISVLESLVKEAEGSIESEGRWSPSISFPRSVSKFILWDDATLGIKRMSRDSIYGAKHKDIRLADVQRLIGSLINYSEIKSSRSSDIERLRALLSEERKRTASLASQLHVLRDDYLSIELKLESVNEIVKQREKSIAELRSVLSKRTSGGLTLIKDE